MRKMYLVFVIGSLSLISPYALAFNCEFFFSSHRLKSQISNFKLYLQNNKNVWNGYNINNELVIFTDLIDAPNCYVMLNDGDVIRSGSLENELKITNNVYDFIYSNRGNTPEEFSTEMIRLGKNEAMIFSLHNWTFLPQYIKTLVGENALIFNMILHEGFHLFYQRRSAVNPSSNLLWPTWLESPEHEDIVSNCYHHPKIIRQYYKEANALTRSAKLLYVVKDSIAAIEAAKDFISLREERYQSIGDNNLKVQIIQASRSVSCQLAEASLEIDEGVTNFIGTKTTLNMGLIANFQFIEFSNLLDFNPYFYSASQLQLYLLSGLVSEYTFEDIKYRISRSSDPSVNVYSIFKEAIEKY